MNFSKYFLDISIRIRYSITQALCKHEYINDKFGAEMRMPKVWYICKKCHKTKLQ